MTPAARIAAAIEVLDDWLAGKPIENCLTDWARGHRFAGSGDRAAIRDHVFQAIRCKRSYARLGGAMSGRGLMLGQCRAEGTDPAIHFGAGGFAPDALNDDEAVPGSLDDATDPERHDCPDWLWRAAESWLDDRAAFFDALRERAPVFLRVNPLRSDRPAAMAALRSDGIGARPHPTVSSALEVIENARRLKASKAMDQGLFELQDAHSQAVLGCLSIKPRERVLDFCAGGGGKSLAIAGMTGREVIAHDADPKRMRDLPARAARAGADIRVMTGLSGLAGDDLDLILCDVPCSGSGSWRRDPAGKWALTADRISELAGVQAGILRHAARLAGRQTRIGYVTCSAFRCENRDSVDAFLSEHPDWSLLSERQFMPGAEGDGFYVAELTQP